MSTPVIHAENLTKTFGSTKALDGLELEVSAGEVHGFLGPNGSGKSTTIRIVLGLMRATSGTVTLFGHDPWTDAVALHRRLAYVPGDVTLWPKLTGGQCIDILARAHGHLDEKRRAELVERFELDPTKKARDYSKGNRQKVSLIAALATDAELLVLDEPTSGLDPLMEQVFQSVVAERSHAGTTVLLSSHILAEVEALADRVSIIRDGKRVLSGTLGELRQHTHSDVWAITNQRPDLDGTAGVSGLSIDDHDGGFAVRCSVEPDAVGSVVGHLHTSGLESLTVTPPSLDDLFLHAYAGSGEATAGSSS